VTAAADVPKMIQAIARVLETAEIPGSST